MVNIKPLKGIRYDKNKIDIASVITPPYDVISSNEIEEYKARSEYSFINIILNKNHDNAAFLLKKWLKEGILKQDEKESIYIYTQTFRENHKEHTRIGFIALAELEELGKNILPHEKTLAKPINDRLDLMKKTRFNLGNILFLYDDRHKIIDELLIDSISSSPDIIFSNNSGVIHELWRIDDEEFINTVTEEMKKYQVIIGDGHHRYKTSLEFQKLHPELNNAKYRVGCFINSFNEGMLILPTNRLLFNIDFNSEILLEKLKQYFIIEEIENKNMLVDKVSSVEIMINKQINLKNHVIGFIDNNNRKCYSLKLIDSEIMNNVLPNTSDVYRKLDVNVLHKLVFERLLGITDEEQCQGTKIEFVKGHEDSLRKLEDKKYRAAFLLNPPLMREIFLTARMHETMPQKSTYFYPKIFSGLVLYNLYKLEDDKKMANKLFIPGPTEVRDEILQELAVPQIGHRTETFKKLFASLKPGLKKIFYTSNDVLISTSSGSGFWESAIRCCVNKKVLHAVNGAFSKKWADVSERCGREVTIIKFEDGNAVKPAEIDEALSKENYEAFCMVHNETSTGVASNLDEIAEIMKKYPNVLWFVDAVSSLGGMKIEVDKIGIDICLASSQKCLALPAGIAFASVSARAYKKAESVKARGYYFDILELKKEYDKDQTPYTPSIPHLYALKKQLERIEEEGIEERFSRHREMAEYVRNWAKENGFTMFSEDGYHSDTVSCIINTKKLDFKTIKKEIAKKGFSIDSGYSKMNDKLEAEGKLTTFRIAHMGDLTLEEIKEMTAELERYF